ncbi:MAG: hypothetical protein IBJ08_06045 [Pseudomonas sp.]|nr:hypothetical protein [Pseudomonas sp.]
MKQPHVLPHSSVPEFVERAGLCALERRKAYAACADALGKGARVVLVLWEAPDWQLLAVQPPEDATQLSTPEVLALVDGWPERVAMMLGKSRRGVHYTWLELRRQPAHICTVH